ncbi:MAG: FMN-binding protein [Alphaproteobacteria bacterium CG11_big_fil_rev_8_21_14_0_20_44_7]|nr:MAG: FMN-binding protein [Alphaproteobacteria bacterium CG11_big_fil_rev_8_21_14_0_20_44_7]
MKYILFLLSFLLIASANAEDILQPPEEFIAESFAGNAPKPKILWIDSEKQEIVNKIMKRNYSLKRTRYWMEGEKSVWILEEIGKVRPITTGFVIDGDKLENVKVLVYRESHGWEVKYPFFTDQFREISLKDNYRLTKRIDGISGATLSVNALKRLAALALFLNNVAKDKDYQNEPQKENGQE